MNKKRMLGIQQKLMMLGAALVHTNPAAARLVAEVMVDLSPEGALKTVRKGRKRK